MTPPPHLFWPADTLLDYTYRYKGEIISRADLARLALRCYYLIATALQS
ncbi:MAG: hypothetical protein JWR54_3963 [Mucilaginibacter sp.]|nr:hypothetical protein [Mucilaginibacter sp.]